MATAKIYHPKTKELINEYYIEDRLKRNLDTRVIESLKKKDKDCVLVVDGREGSGKSTFAMQIGKYVDPTLNLDRVVFSPEDFREAILKANKYQCIIYDEAFTGFSSRASLSPVNRVLVSLAMQMRQKNLFIIIVLPTIFLLDKYMAIFRTRALIHIYESKGRRGYFKLYNSSKKKWLILGGQKTMTYKVKGLWTKFTGRFYGKFALGDAKVEEKYRKNKEKALSDSEKGSMTSAQVRYREQRDLLMFLFRKFTKMKYQEMANLLADYELVMSLVQISRICAKFGDISDEKDKKNNKNEEKVGKVTENKQNEAVEHDLDEFHGSVG
jgi:predicted kinase